MRTLVLLALLLMAATASRAARRVRVAQLEDTLAKALAAHSPDTFLAREIGSLELVERLTPATLDRLARQLPLEPQTALALQLLADQSEFLDPPSAEIPPDPVPSPEAQQKTLDAARAYAVQTWSHLPNFFVDRVTTRFDDGAQVPNPGEWPVRAGLHPVNTLLRKVTFRNGAEIADTSDATAPGVARAAEDPGLHSWGEFGPALTVVLTDMVHGKAVFHHWEQTPAGPVAVYHYEVPRGASHYAVTYSSSDTTVVGRTQFGYAGQARSPAQVANIPRGRETHTYQETPGYHGVLAIDPASGAILRLTIEAHLGGGDPLLRAATAIEYGIVTIGDRAFTCPLRSIAISVDPNAASACAGSAAHGDPSAWQSPTRPCSSEPVLHINETRFTNYHRLGSSARILLDAAAAPPGGSADAPDASLKDKAGAPAGTTASLPANVATPNMPVPAASPAASVPSAASAAPAAPPVIPPPPAEPEISMAPAASLPNTAARAVSGPDAGFSLRVTSRLVNVGLVAYDKKGHPVTDLQAEDLEMYDNGQKREIRSFAREQDAPAPAHPGEPLARAEPAERSFSNRGAEPGSTGVEAGPATILLIDEGRIAWQDMENARAQILRYLPTLGDAERVGLYSMNAGTFHVLVEPTSDHALLGSRLRTFMPTGQSVAQAQEEESRTRQSFEEVRHAADLNSVNGNRADMPDSSQTVDPQLLTKGSDPARASLIVLGQVARHLASMPGRKNLVWISTDNVFADFGDQQVGIDKSPKNQDRFALHAQEALNEAHAAVYPFDVSQLESGSIAADIRHRNVELSPAAQDNAAAAASGGGTSPSSGSHDLRPGRALAQMNQDLHPIQGPVRDLAQATGGRVIRRASDLSAQLAGIVEDGHAAYQLSFTPAGEADDTFHRLEVKLAHRKGLALRYRTGYLFDKEPVSLKDRFNQGIWKPTDNTDIALATEVEPLQGSASIHIRIAGNDLAMEQQADRWMDKLDIFYIQRDDAGLHAHLEGQTLGLRLKSATHTNVLAQGVPFDHAVTLKPGMASVRVLVVDENSGRMGSVTIPAAALHITQ